MEIIIRFIEGAHTDKGVSYWKIEDNEGRKFTAWDKLLIPQLEESIGKPVDLIIKTSPDGKYQNIRGVNTGSETASTPAPSPTLQNVKSVNILPSAADDRSKSIIAQCLVKAVIRNMGEAPSIKRAVGLYNEALGLLN